jgi:hypothetical protein
MTDKILRLSCLTLSVFYGIMPLVLHFAYQSPLRPLALGRRKRYARPLSVAGFFYAINRALHSNVTDVAIPSSNLTVNPCRSHE